MVNQAVQPSLVDGSLGRFGFVVEPVGTHGSRTIMLSELQLLLDACEATSSAGDYRTAIIDDNVLLKRTLTTRKESHRRLRELYALDPDVLLFHALRGLWADDPASRPMLALLCAAARDPILRVGAPMILAVPRGAQVTPQMIEAATESAFPGRWNPTMLANIGRHAASSWQQAGLLAGRLHKVRAQPACRPASAAYALLLGYLCDARGDRLFHTLWANLLDAPEHMLREAAVGAARRGWLEYRHAGGVTEITFQYLLRDVPLEPA